MLNYFENSLAQILPFIQPKTFLIIILVLLSLQFTALNFPYSKYIKIDPLRITIMVILGLFFVQPNVLLAEEITMLPEAIYGELDAFMLDGFRIRIKLIEEISESADVDTLKDIALNLQHIINQQSSENINDPFSGSIISHNSQFNQTHYLKTFGLFLMLMILGIFMIKFVFIAFPVVFYRYHVASLLEILVKDPELYMESIANYYNILSDIDEL